MSSFKLITLLPTLYLLSILFFSSISFAQASFRVESIHEYPQAKNQVSNRFLRALQLDARGSSEASAVWKELKTEFDESSTIYHYSVRDEILTKYTIPQNYDGQPPTEKQARTLILLSRFLFWNNYSTRAIKILQSSKFKNSQEKTLAGIELIKLYLYFGKYERAVKLIQQLKPEDQDLRFQVDLLQEWYLLLTQQFSAIQQLHQKLEEDYLYFVLHLPLESQVIFRKQQKIQQELLQNLTRFPNQQILLEQLVLYYTQVQSWEALDTLLRSISIFPQKKVNYFPLLSIPLFKKEKWPEFQKFHSQLQTAATPLQKLELKAQLAISLQDWNSLEQTARTLIHQYPKLLDGKLYLALFYLKTGQEEKRQSVLEETQLYESSSFLSLKSFSD